MYKKHVTTIDITIHRLYPTKLSPMTQPCFHPHLPLHAAADQRVVAEDVAPHVCPGHRLEAQQRLRPLRAPAVANDGPGEVGHGTGAMVAVGSFQWLGEEKNRIRNWESLKICE